MASLQIRMEVSGGPVHSCFPSPFKVHIGVQHFAASGAHTTAHDAEDLEAITDGNIVEHTGGVVLRVDETAHQGRVTKIQTHAARAGRDCGFDDVTGVPR